MNAKKTLLIRFSSLGDVTQTLSVAYQLQASGHEVHWAVRSDLSNLLDQQPYISHIWPLDTKSGLKGLWQLIQELKNQNFEYCYDAHRSLRSLLMTWALKLSQPKIKILKRPLSRMRRWLWIRFKWPTMSGPKSAQLQLLAPLKAWNVTNTLPTEPILTIPPSALSRLSQRLLDQNYPTYIALAPSAAHPLKRWNLTNWTQLINLLPDSKFIILGGPQDQFLNEIVHSQNHHRVLNLAGQLNLIDSAAIIARAQLVISNDTGLMHIAEQLRRPTIALMGPAPFGYPAYPSTQVLEWDLPCRPCSKHGQGPCTNPHFQACLQLTTPQMVVTAIQKIGS